MIASLRAHTTLPVADIEAGRAFWEGRLGFQPLLVQPSIVLYSAGHGSVFAISRTTGRPSGAHTQMALTSTSLEADLADLRARGVTPIDYDLPLLTTVGGIAQLGPNRAAWFNDPEGNLVAIIEFGET